MYLWNYYLHDGMAPNVNPKNSSNHENLTNNNNKKSKFLRVVYPWLGLLTLLIFFFKLKDKTCILRIMSVR